MPIEITGRHGPQTNGAGEGARVRPGTGDPAAQKQAATGTTQDTVSLTGTAALLQRVDAELAAQPVVDMKRVDAIRQAIADGTFSIDPQRVADKMMQVEGALQARGLG